MVTLLQALRDATGLSRRKAFDTIRAGHVTIAGRKVVDPSAGFEGGALAMDGLKLKTEAPTLIYLLLHKPAGYVTTRSDEMGRETVFELIPDELFGSGLHTVGRLDRDTSGLLLLTNDGDLTYHLTHPSHEVEKEYWVGLAHAPSVEQLTALERGVEIEGGLAVPRDISWLEGMPEFDVSVTISEGRKRQVRYMFEAVGARVVRLHRSREGPLRLGRLPEGEVRQLTAREVKALRKS
jgi:pseudouridine synthase